ncbi:MAG: response regulator [Patescibacteria group bacterium]
MLKEKKILIVEDDPMLLHLLANGFRKAGYTVFEAVNGHQGIETASQEKPSIVVLDIIMPKVDGVTVYKALRASGAVIVIWTNLSQKEVEAAIGESGIDYHAKAECSLEQLISHIREI